MEVIDLDKVLDDFELSEGNSSPVVVPGKEATPSGLQQYLEQEDNVYKTNISLDDTDGDQARIFYSYHTPTTSGICYDTPYDEIDIADADFGPSPPRSADIIAQEIHASKTARMDDQRPNISLQHNGVPLEHNGVPETSRNDFNTQAQVHVPSDAIRHAQTSFPLPDPQAIETQRAFATTQYLGGRDISMPTLMKLDSSEHSSVGNDGALGSVVTNASWNNNTQLMVVSSELQSDSDTSISLSEAAQSDTLASVSPQLSIESSPVHAVAKATGPESSSQTSEARNLESTAAESIEGDTSLLSNKSSPSHESNDSSSRETSPQLSGSESHGFPSSTEPSFREPSHSNPMPFMTQETNDHETGEPYESQPSKPAAESVEPGQVLESGVSQASPEVSSSMSIENQASGSTSVPSVNRPRPGSLGLSSAFSPAQSVEDSVSHCDSSVTDSSVTNKPVSMLPMAPVAADGASPGVETGSSGEEQKAVGFGSDDDDLDQAEMEAYFSDMTADNQMLSKHSSECQAANFAEAKPNDKDSITVSHSGACDVMEAHSDSNAHGDMSVVDEHVQADSASCDTQHSPQVAVSSMPVEGLSLQGDECSLQVQESSSQMMEPSQHVEALPKTDSPNRESLPQTNKSLRQVEKSLQDVEESLPQVEESLPQADESLPQAEECLPQAEESFPQAEESEDRRGSTGSADSVEKFLAIPVTSPIVATPMEETGFSKVPGYVPDVSLVSLEEEPSPDELEPPIVADVIAAIQLNKPLDIVISENNAESENKAESKIPPSSLSVTPPDKENTPPFGASGPSSLESDPGRTQTGIGARPKDPNFAKRGRPTTLLGLSKPDLNLAPTSNKDSLEEPVASDNAIIKPYPEYENSHDVINRQLAQSKRSPLHKKQMNLEIKQQMSEQRLQDHSLADNKMMEAEALIQGEIPVDQYRRREQSPDNQLSSVVPAFQAGIEPTLSLPPPGSFEHSKQKRPTSLSIIPNSNVDATFPEDPSPSDDPGAASSAGHTPYMPHDVAAAGPAGLVAGPGAFSPPMGSANLNVSITQLGKVAPHWIPDAEAPNCMECDSRFTFTKRRHHCRACGKVFCSACCSLKCKLHYMDNKEARVCSKCYQDIVRAQAYERLHSPPGMAGPETGGSGGGNRSPNPNNPSEYCSTIPPLQQAQASLHAPPPTVMVPVGVLRKEGSESESFQTPESPLSQGSQRHKEPKQVMFSDGIRPGGDLTELDGSAEPRILSRKAARAARKVERLQPPEDKSPGGVSASSNNNRNAAKTKRIAEGRKSVCLIPDKGLPPVILSTGVKGDYSVEENPNPEKLIPQIGNTDDASPVVFAINKNLFVLVKIVNLTCCVNRTCWCFTTQGMCTVGQDEMVIVLECLPDEKTIPRDIFCHFNSVYEEAGKGNTVSHLGHTIFGQSFLDSKDHCGFLYIRPSFQCLQKLSLPPAPYVFGILLQRWETPWAKVFPIRLMLRLGAEFRYYPCPLISVRFRKPVYGEIGHTIMNLLADFTNFQYMLPQIKGVVIHMEDKKTYINFPRNRYDEVMKVINNSNDHVMALGANFSMEADSHLVCIQNDEGNYQTQAINIQNKARKVTGASFVVFNGALKTSSGLRAKSSIVEDGLMVQITADAMAALKQSLRDMRDTTIGCGSIDTMQPEEQVFVQWVEEDRNVNIGVKSPVDGMRLDGTESVHIHLATDYVGENRTIRWTEVFFIENDEGNSRCEPVDLSRLAEMLSQATCMALTPHLDKLKEAGLTRIGLRATIDTDKVGYEVGACGEKLPDFYMNDLDNELIPVIHNAANNSQSSSLILELIFHVIE